MCIVVRVFLLLIGVILLFPASALDAQTPEDIRIVDIDSTDFPDIHITVSYRTIQGAPITSDPQFRIQINGTSVDPVEVLPEPRKLPISVAIIADLSARMSDTIGGLPSRHLKMQLLVDEFIDRLTVDLDPQQSTDGISASLTVFTQTVTLVHPLITDLGAVGNTVSNNDGSFTSDVLDSVPDGSPYPLNDALQMGLDQLRDADPQQPRVLVLFAAGDAGQSVDTKALRQELDMARAEKRPIQVVIFGFGADQPNSYTRFPANPAGLRQLANDLGGTFIPIGDKPDSDPLDPQTKELFDAQVAALLQLSEHNVLRCSANTIAAGTASVSVYAGDTLDTYDTYELNIPVLPPRFYVKVDQLIFQDRVRLFIETEFQQSPIHTVKYFLNGIEITEKPIEQGPDFEFPIDVYAADFQRRFPPGKYQLSAAAWDENGKESRSEPITITVLAPPPPEGPVALALASLQQYWWGLLILIAVIGTSILMWRRPWKYLLPLKSPAPPTPPESEADEVSVRIEPEEGTVRHEQPDDPTERHGEDEETERFHPAQPPTPPQVRWFIEILEGEGDEQARIPLPSSKRHYDIGRSKPGYTPQIVLKNRKVTRGQHATLELLLDSLQLIAGESENGTFTGEDKTRLEPSDSVVLHPGDVFWISPVVKLRVVEISHND